MSMKHTPMIADSETIETLKLAEEISTFFEDQKLRAQDRIRQCEAFINNLHLPSKSVKEGMFVLIYMPNRLRTQYRPTDP